MHCTPCVYLCRRVFTRCALLLFAVLHVCLEALEESLGVRLEMQPDGWPTKVASLQLLEELLLVCVVILRLSAYGVYSLRIKPTQSVRMLAAASIGFVKDSEAIGELVADALQLLEAQPFLGQRGNNLIEHNGLLLAVLFAYKGNAHAREGVGCVGIEIHGLGKRLPNVFTPQSKEIGHAWQLKSISKVVGITEEVFIKGVMELMDEHFVIDVLGLRFLGRVGCGGRLGPLGGGVGVPSVHDARVRNMFDHGIVHGDGPLRTEEGTPFMGGSNCEAQECMDGKGKVMDD